VLKNIIQTIFARYFSAFLNLLLIFINSRILGINGMGLTGVILASVSLTVVFNSILCGNTIVYFMNRYNVRYVFYPAYIWAFAGSATACGILTIAGMMPAGYCWAVFTLSALLSLINTNTLILLGLDKVKAFNMIHIILGLMTFLCLMLIYFVFGYKTVTGYLTGLYTAYAFAFLLSLLLLLPALKKKKTVETSFWDVLKEMFVYGLWGGVDNLSEGLTTRLNYFLINKLGGYGNVGLLDSGTKISESVWHLSNSVSYIEYNSVSKTTDTKEQKRVTLQLFKLTFFALALVTGILVMIPEWIFTDYLLTAEFAGISKVIAALGVGIVTYGSNRILSHFFIGSGNIRYSAFCSIFGLIVLVVAGLFIIPAHGVVGAAVTSSVAFTAMLVFSCIVFNKLTNSCLKEFLPSKDDIAVLRKILKIKT